MTAATQIGPRGSGSIFTLAVFLGAGLVFLVEPMIARMILPRLGGSSAVWNTALAFFQLALLAGYAYAHLLQRLSSARLQMGVHLAVLGLSAIVLPLHISNLMGPPSVTAPALWLMGALALSVGPPFAALSATAPLVQSWYARSHGMAPGKDPYVLYVASNLGSLLALLAYPVIVEPTLRLGTQSLAWSLAYGLFVIVVLALIGSQWRASRVAGREATGEAAQPVAWRDRLAWLLLAAAPSSLLLGVTGHITADIASAPFLWVIPLALYLVTFILAFQARPLIPPASALLMQAAFTPGALALLSASSASALVLLPVNLGAFFFAALVCHQHLVALRPPPRRLTEFYLWVSIGGVVGGGFNAFLAPVLFNGVWEYPIVLVLACLARPSVRERLRIWEWAALAFAVASAAAIFAFPGMERAERLLFLAVPALAAVVVMRRSWTYAIAMAALAISSVAPNMLRPDFEEHRSFFGVVQVNEAPSPTLGMVRVMVHGSTLHGTEAVAGPLKCVPTTYYASNTPIGQVMRSEEARHVELDIGAVGLGTGAVSAYVRPTDRMTFFEIDPMIGRLSYDGEKFRYVKDCAKGPVGLVLGDARLSLEKAPDASFDVLLVDAFSSDSVPVHLMTTQAMRTYLRVIKPTGVVILHLSNRNLALLAPAAASMLSAGGRVLQQTYYSDAHDGYAESSSQVIIAARNPQALAPYAARSQWTQAKPDTRPWTDDYTNVFGALVRRVIAGPDS